MSEKTKNPNKKPNYTLRRIVALGAIAALGTGAYEGVSALTQPGKVSGSTMVREYVVKPYDTPWELANTAFPDKAGSAAQMFDVRQEIISQLPNDESHRDGTLQPGDVLIFSDSAHLGQEKQYQEAVKDAPGASEFQNSGIDSDGQVVSIADHPGVHPIG